MRIKFLNIIKITAVILILIVLFAGCKKPPEEKVEVGYTAPDFSVELLNGDTVKLSDYRGKAVFLNFWATWCGPCVNEMPEIQQLSEAFPDDLVVLAVNCSEMKYRVEDFINQNSYTFNIGLDEDGDIQKLYPTNGIPYTVVVDPEGIITELHLGSSTFSVFEGYVNNALGK